MRTCSTCGNPLSHAHVNARYCSDSCRYRAQWERRRKAVCRGCGVECGYAASVKIDHLCRACRAAEDDHAERRDCKCPTCRRRRAARSRAYRAKRNASGVPLGGGGSRWISSTARLSIYERDRWTCWLCQRTVDRALIGTHSTWRPSLDHIVPRIHGGGDDASNLRLAHFRCNARRSDGRFAPEDFRVAA